MDLDYGCYDGLSSHGDIDWHWRAWEGRSLQKIKTASVWGPQDDALLFPSLCWQFSEWCGGLGWDDHSFSADERKWISDCRPSSLIPWWSWGGSSPWSQDCQPSLNNKELCVIFELSMTWFPKGRAGKAINDIKLAAFNPSTGNHQLVPWYGDIIIGPLATGGLFFVICETKDKRGQNELLDYRSQGGNVARIERRLWPVVIKLRRTWPIEPTISFQ